MEFNILFIGYFTPFLFIFDENYNHMKPFAMLRQIKLVDNWPDQQLQDSALVLEEWLSNKPLNEKTEYYYKRLKLIQSELKYRQKNLLILN